MLAHCPNLKHPRIAILCNLARASGIFLGTRIAGDLDFHVEPVRAGNLDMGLPLMMLPYTDVIGASFSATGEARGGSLDPGLNVSVPRHFPHIITSRFFSSLCQYLWWRPKLSRQTRRQFKFCQCRASSTMHDEKQEIIVKTAEDPNGRLVLGPNEPIFLRSCWRSFSVSIQQHVQFCRTSDVFTSEGLSVLDDLTQWPPKQLMQHESSLARQFRCIGAKLPNVC